MKHTLKVSMLSAMVAMLSACALTEAPEPQVVVQEQKICMDKRGQIVNCPSNLTKKIAKQKELEAQGEAPLPAITAQYKQSGNKAHYNDVQEVESLPEHSLTYSEHSILINEYIEQIAAELLSNVATSESNAVIGVTSFVDFSNDLRSVTPIGNVIAENFTTQLYLNGFSIADYKVKGSITVADNGDYVFSRQADQLQGSEMMSHVLAGTIMYQQKGLVINARIVNFDDKSVISTASGFIPYFVLDSMVPAAAKQVVF